MAIAAVGERRQHLEVLIGIDLFAFFVPEI
jgi:hypothetical protein